jgi:hypothetical protein
MAASGVSIRYTASKPNKPSDLLLCYRQQWFLIALTFALQFRENWIYTIERTRVKKNSIQRFSFRNLASKDSFGVTFYHFR